MTSRCRNALAARGYKERKVVAAGFMEVGEVDLRGIDVGECEVVSCVVIVAVGMTEEGRLLAPWFVFWTGDDCWGERVGLGQT